MTSKTSDETTTVRELKGWMQTFVAERQWERFHNAKNLSMSIAIEAAELMEHFQWSTAAEVEGEIDLDLDAVSDELADVACYVLSLANALEIDLSSAIEQKMAKNRQKYPPT